MSDLFYVEVGKTEGALSELYEKIKSVINKYKNGKNLTDHEYVRFLFGYNIYLKSVDILCLIREHKNKKNKIKTSIYLIFRSILEDYFYFKSMVSQDKDQIKKHINAYFVNGRQAKIKLLKSLQSLQDRGILSRSGGVDDVLNPAEMQKRIRVFEEAVEEFSRETDDDTCSKYRDIKKICEEYDVEMRNKGENIGEDNSLETLYWFLYRFVSMETHQGDVEKESVFEVVLGKPYSGDNLEILKTIARISRSSEWGFLG